MWSSRPATTEHGHGLRDPTAVRQAVQRFGRTYDGHLNSSPSGSWRPWPRSPSLPWATMVFSTLLQLRLVEVHHDIHASARIICARPVVVRSTSRPLAGPASSGSGCGCVHVGQHLAAGVVHVDLRPGQESRGLPEVPKAPGLSCGVLMSYSWDRPHRCARTAGVSPRHDDQRPASGAAFSTRICAATGSRPAGAAEQQDGAAVPLSRK